MWLARSVGSTLLLVFAASASQAATLWSPIMIPGNGSATCEVVNVSPRVREITLTLFDSEGSVLGSKECPEVQPRALCFLMGDGDTRYCKVEVNGGEKAIRGSLIGFDSDGELAAAVPITD